MTMTGACPGILDLHEARDGLVARIRLPGGYSGAGRLRSLAAMAERFGDGCVDLTARGNVQIRGIPPGAADGMAQQAAAAGFLPSPAHDRARNITASPLAGLAGRPGLRGLIRALDRAILADPRLAELPGRFLFSLDDGTGRAALGSCDIGLRCHAGEVELIVAGRQTGLRETPAAAIRAAITAARAFIGQRRGGNGPEVTGLPGQRVAPSAVGPGDGQLAGPAGQRAGAASEPASARVRGLADGGSAVAAAAGGALGEQVHDTTDRLPLGAVPAAAPVVVVAAPLGRLTAVQVRLIAGLLHPAEVARLGAAGRIVIPLAGEAGKANPAGEAVRAREAAHADVADVALDRLAEAGLLASDDHALSAVTACAGAACVRSLADVRALATRVPGHDAVHWAGCSRRCGLPPDATAVVAWSADGFTVGDDAVLGVAARPA
jgi:precorrin-3B synthase